MTVPSPVLGNSQVQLSNWCRWGVSTLSPVISMLNIKMLIKHGKVLPSAGLPDRPGAFDEEALFT